MWERERESYRSGPHWPCCPDCPTTGSLLAASPPGTDSGAPPAPPAPVWRCPPAGPPRCTAGPARSWQWGWRPPTWLHHLPGPHSPGTGTDPRPGAPPALSPGRSRPACSAGTPAAGGQSPGRTRPWSTGRLPPCWPPGSVAWPGTPQTRWCWRGPPRCTAWRGQPGWSAGRETGARGDSRQRETSWSWPASAETRETLRHSDWTTTRLELFWSTH